MLDKVSIALQEIKPNKGTSNLMDTYNVWQRKAQIEPIKNGLDFNKQKTEEFINTARLFTKGTNAYKALNNPIIKRYKIIK